VDAVPVLARAGQNGDPRVADLLAEAHRKILG
jgi:hypothetical protein